MCKIVYDFYNLLTCFCKSLTRELRSVFVFSKEQTRFFNRVSDSLSSCLTRCMSSFNSFFTLVSVSAMATAIKSFTYCSENSGPWCGQRQGGGGGNLVRGAH